MWGSGHSLPAVARPSHTAQHTEAVCFLGEGAGSRSCELGGSKGWGGRGSSRSVARLDVLTALHLWFVLSGLHLDVDHVVARRHVALLTLRHLLLGDDAVDF